MLPTVEKKALSYTLLRELDPGIIQKLEHDDGPSTLDVVDDTVRTSSPGWVYYYLSEADEEPDAISEQIPAVIPKQKFIERAKDYADKDAPVINLNTPAEQNWMSEDPLEPVRDAYQDRLSAIETAIRDALSNTGLELSEEQTGRLAGLLFEEVDPLQWEVNRVKHRDGDSGKASDGTVATKYVRSRKMLIKELVEENDIDVTPDEVDNSIERASIRETYTLPSSVQRERVKKLREQMDEDNPLSSR